MTRCNWGVSRIHAKQKQKQEWKIILFKYHIEYHCLLPCPNSMTSAHKLPQGSQEAHMMKAYHQIKIVIL